MKIINIKITLLTLLFISLPLIAQEDTKPFHFPHKTGDMWEYFYSEGGPYGGPSDTNQVITVFDSTDSNGLIHIIQNTKFINPISDSYFLKYWIDTLNHYVLGEGMLDSTFTLIYKLDAVQDEEWIVYSVTGGTGYNFAKVRNKWVGTIFGIETNFIEISYYSVSDPNDTLTWLHLSDRIIADNLGLVYWGGGDLFADYNLIGTVIGGKLYGDTTLVSIKNNFQNLPSRISLNQNYPNPFNPSTTISFQLRIFEKISLIIYDVLGNEVLKLIDNQDFSAGEHKAFWNGLNESRNRVASGIYFYRLISKNQTISRSMILLK